MPRLTVLHASDLQCGRPYVPEAGDALVSLFGMVAPDVVVVSGDLTQRAKRREFRQARALLDRLGDTPIVVTPGNHDVPLFRVWERLATPYRNWRRFSGSPLDTVTRIDGATLVALNSSTPLRAIVNGRIDDDQLDFAREAFDASASDGLRIAVIHHHLVPVPSGEGGAPLPRARLVVEALVEMGADVVLGGHVHRVHLRTSADLRPGASEPTDPEGEALSAGSSVEHGALPILACGTTTSRRGRGPEAGWNSLCVLRFDDASVRVTPYKRRVGGADFEACDPVTWPLRHATGKVD